MPLENVLGGAAVLAPELDGLLIDLPGDEEYRVAGGSLGMLEGDIAIAQPGFQIARIGRGPSRMEMTELDISVVGGTHSSSSSTESITPPALRKL
jgi:hypothetical protein